MRMVHLYKNNSLLSMICRTSQILRNGRKTKLRDGDMNGFGDVRPLMKWQGWVEGARPCGLHSLSYHKEH